MTTRPPDFLEWLRQKLGTTNWVVARRTPRVINRYGDDVVAISQKRYSRLAAEWQDETGIWHPAAERTT